MRCVIKYINPFCYYICLLFEKFLKKMYIFAKAQENLKAAELLIANAMYASSIHCSYYASLQLSKREVSIGKQR